MVPMNKEEFYKLAINNVQKYSLLNEIFAIRDERVEQVDYTIGVNGFISLDSLNKYVELIDYINQLETNRDELKKWLEEFQEDICYDTDGEYFCKDENMEIKVQVILDKMQELERGKE